MTPDHDDNPLEQLVELLVYAPIGLLYEYPDVLPRLVRRGKSQVQLAKFAGQMAIRQQQNRGAAPTDGSSGSSPTPSPDMVLDGLARLITDVGAMIGLAPPTETRPGDTPAASAPEADEAPEAPSTPAAEKPPRLPIANYDELTAKQIIFLLDDLTAPQLERVRRHEVDNRNRKTVLAKIDRLSS